MTVDEASRHSLHQRLADVLGLEHAAVLMEHLPMGGSAEVVTKHDLIDLRQGIDHQFQGIDQRFVAVDQRFDALEARIDASEYRVLAAVRGEMIAAISTQTRTIVLALIASVATMGGVSIGIAGLR
ncbi:MAG: hypothetical protein ACR2G7_04005 [Acidimicrobiales bacterium]